MESTPAFVELPGPEIKPKNECITSSAAVTVIRGANGFTIELHENASAELMKYLIGACAMLNDACGFIKMFFATGYTDLRCGMEGMDAIIRF